MREGRRRRALRWTEMEGTAPRTAHRLPNCHDANEQSRIGHISAVVVDVGVQTHNLVRRIATAQRPPVASADLSFLVMDLHMAATIPLREDTSHDRCNG